jgi:hypothetical protein
MGHKRATLGRFECSLPINRLAERPVAARLQLGIPALVSFGSIAPFRAGRDDGRLTPVSRPAGKGGESFGP